jgi:hypothetical protein
MKTFTILASLLASLSFMTGCSIQAEHTDPGTGTSDQQLADDYAAKQRPDLFKVPQHVYREESLRRDRETQKDERGFNKYDLLEVEEPQKSERGFNKYDLLEVKEPQKDERGFNRYDLLNEAPQNQQQLIDLQPNN